jgi:hypothetical protein
LFVLVTRVVVIAARVQRDGVVVGLVGVDLILSVPQMCRRQPLDQLV